MSCKTSAGGDYSCLDTVTQHPFEDDVRGDDAAHHQGEHPGKPGGPHRVRVSHLLRDTPPQVAT